MRLIIKWLLKRLVFAAGGFYLSRMRSDMKDVLKHMKALGLRPKTVFDVGVANGTEDIYKAFPDSHFVLVEPLNEFEGYMESMTGKHDLEYIVAAASDEIGSLNINVHPDLCGTSLMKEVEGTEVDGVGRTVPTIRLDQFAIGKKLRAPFLIKVDVQGAELKVLDGASAILDQTEAIILEVSLFGFFVDGPQFSDVVAYMKGKGFVVYEIFDARNRPLDGALAQVDVMFVKEDGKLRKSHVYASESQRAKQNKELRQKMLGK